MPRTCLLAQYERSGPSSSDASSALAPVRSPETRRSVTLPSTSRARCTSGPGSTSDRRSSRSSPDRGVVCGVCSSVEAVARCPCRSALVGRASAWSKSSPTPAGLDSVDPTSRTFRFKSPGPIRCGSSWDASEGQAVADSLRLSAGQRRGGHRVGAATGRDVRHRRSWLMSFPPQLTYPAK